MKRGRQRAPAPIETRPEGRSSRAVAGKPHRDPVLGCWLLPLPTIDPIVVARSGAALPAYGPKFRYSHYAGTKTLRYAAGGARRCRRHAWPRPRCRRCATCCSAGSSRATGPTRAGGRSRGSPSTSSARAAASTVHTRVSGGDPGYAETAKMLAESALCLAFDDNPPTAGQVTTAQAMGDALTGRLIRAGMRFERLD